MDTLPIRGPTRRRPVAPFATTGPSQLVVERLASSPIRRWPTPSRSRVLLFRGPDQLLVGLSSGEILLLQL